MKKWVQIFIFVTVVCMLGGCGNSGVSQEEYDNVVAERDALLAEQENLDWYNIGKEKLIEDAEKAKTNMEENYNDLLKYLSQSKEKYSDYEDIVKSVDEMYAFYRESIDWQANNYVKTSEELSVLMDDDIQQLMDGLLDAEYTIGLSKTAFYTRICENFPGFDGKYDENRLIKFRGAPCGT